MFICLKEKGCTASQGMRQAFSRAVEDRLVVALQGGLVVPSQEALLPWGFTHPTRDPHLEGSAPSGSWNPCLPAPLATAWWYLGLESQLFPPVYCCRLFRDGLVGKQYSLSPRAASFKLIHLVPAVFVWDLVGEVQEVKSHFMKSFVSISWRCIGVGPCFFFFFFTTTLSVQRYRRVDSNTMSRPFLSRWVWQILEGWRSHEGSPSYSSTPSYQGELSRSSCQASSLLLSPPICYLNLWHSVSVRNNVVKFCDVHNFKSGVSKSSLFFPPKFNSEPIEADGCRAD